MFQFVKGEAIFNRKKKQFLTKLYGSITLTAMNANFIVFVIYVEVIIYLVLYNFNDCTFK